MQEVEEDQDSLLPMHQLLVQEEPVEEEMLEDLELVKMVQLIPEEEVEQVIQMEVVEVQESLLLDILQEQHQL